MVRKKEQYRMREMLSEAILVLCKASLEYRAEFSIEGLLGITLDNEEIFLINLNEHVKKDGSDGQSCSREPLSSSPPSSPRSHKRNRKRGKSPPGERQTEYLGSGGPVNKHKRLGSDQEDGISIKNERGSDNEFEEAEDNGMPHPAHRSDMSTSEASDAEGSRDDSSHQQWTLESSSNPTPADIGFDLRQLQHLNAGHDTDNYGSHLSLSTEGAVEGSVPGCSTWQTPSQQQLAAMTIKEEHSQTSAGGAPRPQQLYCTVAALAGSSDPATSNIMPPQILSPARSDITYRKPPQTTKKECPICGKNVPGSRWHLNVHIRSHTGEKPFCCKVCGKAFAHSGNMKQHQTLVHKLPPYTSDPWRNRAAGTASGGDTSQSQADSLPKNKIRSVEHVEEGQDHAPV